MARGEAEAKSARAQAAVEGGLLSGGLAALHLSRDDAILYLTSFFITAIGVWGVRFALDSAPLGAFLLAAVLIGFLISLWLRRLRQPTVGALLVIAGLLLSLLVLRGLGRDPFLWILSDFVLMSEPTLAGIATVGIILAIGSFILVSRKALAFSIIPVLAIFGLLGTLLETRVMIAFLVFLLAAIFLLAYEHVLTLKEEAGLRLPHGQARRLPANQLLISIGFFGAVLIMGVALSLVLMAGLSRESLQRLLDALSRIEQIAPQDPSRVAPQNAPSFNSAGTDYRIGLGPISLGQNTVMRVKTDSPELWRQRSYDLYTGSGWRVAGATRASKSLTLNQGHANLADYPPQGEGGRLVRQAFYLAATIGSGIPAAAQPVEVNFGDGRGAPRMLDTDRFGCLVRADRYLPQGYSYQVLSFVRTRKAPGAISRDEAALRECLMLPWGARKVRDLVDRLLTANLDQQAKMQTLLAHLQSGEYRYTLEPPAVPPDQDAAAFFLFNSKQGYCDLFATAFAMMCRAAGIPSRLAIGYAEGTVDPATGEYVVKEADGHAWVEVFLDDYGWVTVDPTPPTQAAELQKQLRAGPSWWQKTVRRFRGAMTLALVCLVLGAGAAKLLWFDPWWEQRRWEKRMSRTSKGRIAVFYARMCRLIAKRGLLRRAWHTPHEYLELLATDKARFGLALAPARELTRLFVTSRYGDDNTGPEHLAAAQTALWRLRRELRTARRLRLPRQKRS